MAATRRVQILMNPEEYDEVAATAADRGVSVAEVFRSAVRAQRRSQQADRLAAAQRIVALRMGPGFTWSQADLDDAVVAPASELAFP